jgi:hypothetical protein
VVAPEHNRLFKEVAAEEEISLRILADELSIK